MLSAIGTVIFDQIECKDNFDMADNFKTIRHEVNNVQYVNGINVINFKFKFRIIKLKELKAIYKNIKKKSDHNKVSSDMIINS